MMNRSPKRATPAHEDHLRLALDMADVSHRQPSKNDPQAPESDQDRKVEGRLSPCTAAFEAVVLNGATRAVHELVVVLERDTTLAAQCEMPPHIAQYPFEIVSQSGGYRTLLPLFHMVSHKHR